MLVSGKHVGVVMGLEGWGVGRGDGVGCGLEDIYSFTPGHLPTQTFTHLITKTRLFKYIEMFTSKNRKFSGKNSDIFSYFCSKHRLWVLVRTVSVRRYPQSMFLSRNKKNNLYPVNLSFTI